MMNRFGRVGLAPIFAAATLLMVSQPGAAFQAQLKVTPEKDSLEQTLESASLVIAAERDGTTNSQDILAAAQSDYSRLLGALYDNGYFGPVISILIDGQEAATIPPLSSPSSVQVVTVLVEPGKKFRFGAAEIAPLAPETTVPDQFRPGETAKTSSIREAASNGVQGWRAVGHAKADIDQQNIVADHARSRLDVQLRMAPGPKVTFGDLIITSESAVRADRIRSIAGIPKGDVFDPEVLEQSAARLRRSGPFNTVTLEEAENLGANDSLDIELAVVDSKPRRFGFGAEIHSTEGATVSAFWLHRNLLGGAERLRIEGGVSGIGGDTRGYDYHLRARLTRPSTFTTTTDLYLLAEIEQLEQSAYFSRQAQIEVGVTRIVSKTLNVEAGVGYRYADVDDDLGKRQYSHLVLPISATWDRRDDPLNPTTGSYLNAAFMPFVGLRESASGGRGYLDARAYRAIGTENGTVVAGRLQLGTVVGSSIKDTPPDLLFFSGGSGTVRGHSYQSLSISSDDGETGGRSFIGLSGEVRVPVKDKFSVVAFYDVGYIGENSWLDTTGDWQSGAGLGVRYQTGFGPIRFDVAVPATGPKASDIQLYLGIGQAF